MCQATGKHRDGFTLVEVIVALGIFVVGMLGALDLFVSSRNATHDAVIRAKGSAAARGILQTLRAAGPEALKELNDRATAAGEEGAVWPETPASLSEPDTAWQARVKPAPDHPGLLQIEIAVGWDDAATDPLRGGVGNSLRQVEWFPAPQ